MEHGNWIGGERAQADSGGSFEVRSGLEEGEVLGRWPRSGEPDVLAALAALAAAGPVWEQRAEDERREVLLAAARELAREPDPGGAIAARLGLRTAELAPHLAGLEEDLGRDLAGPEEAPSGGLGPGRPGPILVAADAALLLGGMAAALFAALRRGRAVLLLADGKLPMAADAVAAALARAGLPGPALACLHDDGQTALACALRRPEIALARVSGAPARLRSIARLARAPAGGADLFGAGVDERAGLPLELRCLRNASRVVPDDGDPAGEAARVVERAFGRSAALSGQLPGAIGRVLCPQRIFSRFTEEVLSAIASSADVARPVPLLDPATAVHLRRARELGLDEGATLLVEGPPAGEPATVPARSHRAPANGILGPVVLTNVEEHMRSARLARPAPLLCLVRVASLIEGASLGARLDQGTPAEDLSVADEPADFPRTVPRARED